MEDGARSVGSSNLTKVNVSDDHRHKVRLYMAYHRLPSMQAAIAKMIDTVVASEGPYTYSQDKELKAEGTVSAEAG